MITYIKYDNRKRYLINKELHENGAPCLSALKSNIFPEQRQTRFLLS